MKYNTIAEVYDLGPFITKVILEVGQTLSDCDINEETFLVHVKRKDKKTGEVYSEGERKVCAAYISNEEGILTQIGSYITLVLEVDPRISLGSTIVYIDDFNIHVDSDYTITQVKPINNGNMKIEDMVFTELNTKKTLLADDFKSGESTYGGVQLKSAFYQPEKNGYKRPLLIWLHGAGEGGTDPIIAVVGNKVANLISEDIQKHFGGCHVLVPQAPTMWMDDGTGQYNVDGSSMYIESLKNLIDEYIDSNDDIDKERIYIGGCSNGGFMTLKMIIAYPQMFAAAYPICEALPDKFITESDINNIKNIPIWFTHAENDPIVDINKHTKATYKRLIEAGAKDVHFSCFHSVVDQTGLYVNEDRTPYELHGHFSWIPALNDQCILDYNNKPIYRNGHMVTMFEWMAGQKK